MERSIPYRLQYLLPCELPCVYDLLVICFFIDCEVFMQGNLNWMQSREVSMKSSVWNGRESEIRPFGNPKASDSANLDSAAEV